MNECKPLVPGIGGDVAASDRGVSEGAGGAVAEQRQGLTLVHLRAQLEQIQDTFRFELDYTVDRRAQVELKSERV